VTRVAPTPDRPASPPAVQRLRLRYARRGRMRFASHRDFARAFERALHRSGLPVAYSSGFTPHPKISYLGGAPTGTASEAEYLELGLAEPVEPTAAKAALDAALPDGFDVLEVVVAGPAGLADRVAASRWRLEFPDADPGALRRAVEAFLAADSVPVERVSKEGRRTVDARTAVLRATVSAASCGIMEAVVRHVSPAVRPDDILTGLRQVAPVPPLGRVVATRLAQGLPDDSGRLADPLAADR
jgi:radical SAM-linked protein